MALKVLVIPVDATRNVERLQSDIGAAISQVLLPSDHWEIGTIGRLAEPVRWDLIVIWEPCGFSSAARPVAESRIPCLPLMRTLVFHPYLAAFVREMEERGGVLLGCMDPEEIAVSVEAVRAAQTIALTRLLVIDNNVGNARAQQVESFAQLCLRRWGLAIERRPVDELLSLADAQTDQDVDDQWRRWLAELLVDEGEMSREHMNQVVRLYLVLRGMLADTGAHGVTVDDIGAFLLTPERRIMPNAAYAMLTRDGFLCCEEGDIEALTTEAILRAGLGAHPTMSNIYMAYRDELDSLEAGQAYTPDRERSDYRQCIADSHVVATHFGTAGVLPANMMVEQRYRIRETLPAWPGQSMTWATPRLGPVVLARLASDLSRIHVVSGEVDECRMDDRRGWYRGRWMIKLPSATSFTRNCLHQHYAIGPESGRSAVLDTLTRSILRLGRFDEANFTPSMAMH